MLGRIRRTTRTDVGLALSFAGVAFLVWALVAGTTRLLVQDMVAWWQVMQAGGVATELPMATRVVRVIFVDAGIAIDVVGLAWLAGSLYLVVLSGRQRFSISWAWVSAICQSLVAGVGGAWVAWASHRPFVAELARTGQTVPASAMQTVSGISLPVVVAGALVLWLGFLFWLLLERGRFARAGISLRDGLRTNTYR